MENIYLGNTPLISEQKEVKGEFVHIDGEEFYKINNYDQMSDFFMTIVSISDQWMFISSNGSLTAGRKNRDNALFPYYCVDKIHDSVDSAGSKTQVLVKKNSKVYLWEPFSKKTEAVYKSERNIYKSVYGNKIVFEEINHDLEITFKYGWYFSNKYGFIKKSSISNNSDKSISIEIMDGIRNILPFGFDYNFQNNLSNLLDAYKKNELIPETKLGIFSLSSIPVDRAEPSESLKATTVWSGGLNNSKILISERQTDNFQKGLAIHPETEIRASRGAYFINESLNLEANESKEWIVVAEINQDSTEVANLNHFLSVNNDPLKIVFEDIHLDTLKLEKLVANADGLQLSNEELDCTRHYANTLFNLMRGGTFINNYTTDKKDFAKFFQQTNKKLFQKATDWLEELPDCILSNELIIRAEKTEDSDIERICYEYLPLTFSRRHGDPSRPWNQFSIEVQNPDGSIKSDYQGNWRDIFQNWEALAYSFPEFTEQMICKFVNATTADGYNPYRITKNGIDWERPDPEDPWAFIGYWGDHQIIYLQKLLESSNKFHPGRLQEFLGKEMFVYANVPYRIKSYNQMVESPQDTIVFDYEQNSKIDKITEQLGADGKLLLDDNNQLHKANLTEKILTSLLAKLSNFIPEAGIWLNTQRPEWNDANNALVGNGVSMVTLYYMRRSLKFWSDIFKDIPGQNYLIAEEVKSLFDSMLNCFIKYETFLEKGFSDVDRRIITNILGEAGSQYRNKIYDHSFTKNKKKISTRELVEFTEIGLKYLDQTIQVNRRSDGLYHAYNLVTFTKNEIKVLHLYEMLEGQVAVLSSGYLSAKESLSVLDALKKSKLFRKDQYSYILYPDRTLPLFTEKNIISNEDVGSSNLLQALIDNEDRSIIKVDERGTYHFNSSFRNAEILSEALDNLEDEKYGDLVEKEKENIAGIYEKMFDHQSFTGRSGTFFAFEGLGSIYWHMVSKLMLAVQEIYFQSVEGGVEEDMQNQLKGHYFEIKEGIGLHKSPELYGAFPIDAYSHTPAHAGAQQPGMTGQVKEDILARMAELGIHIKNGEIVFETSMINQKEFIKNKENFEYYGLDGTKRVIELQKGQLGFTFCQVPVVFTKSDKERIIVYLKDTSKKELKGNVIDKETSSMIFRRNEEVEKIEFSFPYLKG